MSWSVEENSRFEQALADVAADSPMRWELVAQAVGGGRTADDALHHFLRLQGDTDDMDAQDRANRRRQQYQRNLHHHRADANRRRRTTTTTTTGGGGAGASSSNNNNNNTRAAADNVQHGRANLIYRPQE